MNDDTDQTPLQTHGEAHLLSGDLVEIDIEADSERAILTLCTDSVAVTASLFPNEIERLRTELAAAADRIEPEKAKRARDEGHSE